MSDSKYDLRVFDNQIGSIKREITEKESVIRKETDKLIAGRHTVEIEEGKIRAKEVELQNERARTVTKRAELVKMEHEIAAERMKVTAFQAEIRKIEGERRTEEQNLARKAK